MTERIHPALEAAHHAYVALCRSGYWSRENAREAVCIEVTWDCIEQFHSERDRNLIDDAMRWHSGGFTGPLRLLGFRCYEVMKLPEGKTWRVVSPPSRPSGNIAHVRKHLPFPTIGPVEAIPESQSFVRPEPLSRTTR